MFEVSQPTNVGSWLTVCRCDSYNTARLHIISAPKDIELDEPETDIPAPTTAILPEQAVAGVPTTTEPIVIPSAVCQRPQEQLARTDTESSTVPMDIETTDTRDAEEDEVEFWGGTSPRERALLEKAMRAERKETAPDSDESMSDGEDLEMMGQDDDGDDDVAGEENDQMAIFGHR